MHSFDLAARRTPPDVAHLTNFGREWTLLRRLFLGLFHGLPLPLFLELCFLIQFLMYVFDWHVNTDLFGFARSIKLLVPLAV